VKSVQAIEPFDLIIFGGAGDLSRRKLIPAMYHWDCQGQLPAGSRILSAGRNPLDRAGYHALLEEHSREHARAAAGSADWQAFLGRCDHVQMDAGSADDYAALVERLRELPDADERQRVFYLSTPPRLFAGICRNLAAAGLVTPQSRVVLEKPLGHDGESARQITEDVGEVFAERQVFRIDHYLGKETVQNLIALRFANSLFEPIWRREWIRDVQISVAEQLGVETRGDFYEGAGAMRDMVQNHLLQVLSIVAMEPPGSLDPNLVRDEKLKVLRALRPLHGDDVQRDTVRGQYAAGEMNGQAVPGYRDELNVAPDSRTETYVAIRAHIDTWRWAGVPFYLRTGKRLPQRRAEVVINFRDVPHSIFGAQAVGGTPNRLIIRLQPDEGVQLQLLSKQPGDELTLHPVTLNLSFSETFSSRPLEAYERLLMDVLRDNLTLFVRSDELQAAWQWVDPILAAWRDDSAPPQGYPAGSWGPQAAQALLAESGHRWREEDR
jgi:glucose-6-phosphate 1-dehydrogenase